MADKAIQVGDAVLFYGRTLQVAGLYEENGFELAEVHDKAAFETRQAAIAEIQERRLQQEGLRDDEAHAKIAAEINALDEVAREALFRLRIRRDRLSYWPERQLWVSDGRILSDAQRASFKELMGERPKPMSERHALLFLESAGRA
jgi:hypothetical protein